MSVCIHIGIATPTDISESTIAVTAAGSGLVLVLQKDLSLAGVMINCSYLNKHFDTWKLSLLVDHTGCQNAA